MMLVLARRHGLKEVPNYGRPLLENGETIELPVDGCLVNALITVRSEKLHSEKLHSEKLHSEKLHSEKLHSEKLHMDRSVDADLAELIECEANSCSGQTS